MSDNGKTRGAVNLTIKRPDGQTIDVAGLAAGGPEEAFLLLSEHAQKGIEALSDRVRREVGETIVAFANVIAKIGHQPTIRIDVHMIDGQPQPFLVEVKEHGEPVAISRAMTIQAAVMYAVQKLATISVEALPPEHRALHARRWADGASHTFMYLNEFALKVEAKQ